MPATQHEPASSGASSLDRFFAALHAAPVRRVRNGRVIAGTASGVARYFGVDPIVVRVAFVLITILTGIGITSYLIAWLLLPDDEDALLVERAIRGHEAGPITLAVFAVLSVFSDSGNDKWSHTVVTVPVLGLIGWYLWRRHQRRIAAGLVPPPPAPPAPPAATDRPGAADYGSPTRGGLSRFDPVTGRWVPSAQSQQPWAAPPEPAEDPAQAEANPGTYVTGQVPSPTSHPGRAATWSTPGPADSAVSQGDPVRRPRARLAGWVSALIIAGAAALGAGAAYAIPMTFGVGSSGWIVGSATALLVIAFGLLIAGIRGRTARPLILAALLLLPVATGVAAIDVAPPPNPHFGIQFVTP